MAEGETRVVRPEDGAPPPRSFFGRLRHRDHTQGSLLASVLTLATPSILMSVLGFGLFQMVDLRFLSQLGVDQVAAAGATNQTLRQILMLSIMGLTVASQMLIARSVGQGDIDSAEHVAGQTFLVGGALWALAIVLGFAFAEELVSFVIRDPEVIPLAAIYLRIVFATFGVTAVNQLCASVLAGAGDTTTPMMVTMITTPVAILGEYAFGFGEFGMPRLGIAGIAVGAALGGACGGSVALWALFSGRCRVHLRSRHLRPDWKALRGLLRLAWQPALHMVARSLMVFFFMWLAGRLGGDVQAAYTIGLRIEMLAIMVAFPIANSCATLVGQNLGARDLRRAWQAILTSAAVELAVLWPAALALYLEREPLVALFTSDPVVAEMATDYLVFTSLVLTFYGLYFVAFRTLQAAGDMRSPMLISVGTAVLLGAPTGWILASQADLGARGMWIANFVYAVVNAVLMVGWLLRGHWARAHRGALPTPSPPSQTGGA